MSVVWSKGDTYGPNDSGMYAAGISIKSEKGDLHGNAIECFGVTIEEATLRQGLVLESMWASVAKFGHLLPGNMVVKL